MKGKITIVGLGPGNKSMMTQEVVNIIDNATDIVGYSTYIKRITPKKNLNLYSSDNRDEPKRAKDAINLALNGKNVVVISSGDPGVFAMASVMFETIDNGPNLWNEIDIVVMPGVTAMLAAAAKVGAPLGHDFCAINLSNNLKPWRLIEKRIRLSIECDFVIALYNPRSKSRPNEFRKTLDILRETCEENRYILFAKSVFTKEEKINIVQLKNAKEDMANMQTLVIIGSSLSKIIIREKQNFFYTPRVAI
jgi:precorrin-3B C17-methyltransferase